MSDPAITAYLTKLLCSEGGRLERNRLADLLDLPEEQIEQILQDEPLRFPQRFQLVLAQSPLRICTRYLRPEGEEEEDKCPKLHLCRHYLRGQCAPTRRPPCRFSHDILSEHNRSVLKANELSGLNEDEIKILLFQNDNQLLPEYCRKYREEDCDQGEDCPRLHVCTYFIQGGCNRRVCRKSHNLLDSRLLRSCRWLSQKTVLNFQMLCDLKSLERQQQPRNEQTRDGRAMSRGRGRGKPEYRRRAGSHDLLDSRETRNEGSNIPWRSSSRPPPQHRLSQRSGDEEHNDSDNSSDHGRYTKTRLDNLMDDWFTPSTAQSGKDDWVPQIKTQSGKVQVRLSAGNTPQGETRSVPPNTDSVMSSRANKPLIHQSLVQSRKSPNSSVTCELTTVSYNIPKVDSVSSNATSVTPVPLQERPMVSSRVEKSVFHPTPHTTSGRPTLTTLKSGPSITLPTPLAISSASNSPLREYPSTQPKPTYLSAESVNPPTASPHKVPLPPSSSLNRLLHISTEGSSGAEARVTPCLTVSNNSAISSIKSQFTPIQKTDMELNKGLGPAMTRLSITPSTHSKTSLYSTTESSYITQHKPTTPTVSGYTRASTSSSSSNVSAGSDMNLKHNVKPILKTNTTSVTRNSLTDEDFNFFCQPTKTTVSTATQLQPATNVPSVSPGKASLGQTPEICLTHIWTYCDRGDRCAQMHCSLPYHWQVFNGHDWVDLPNMEDIERAFSNPNTDRYRLIDFQAMKYIYKPVRRLSTPSSVTQPPKCLLTTEWRWYWKSESGTWTEYGQLTTENMSGTIISSDLETIYQSDPNGTIPFTAGDQSYVIDCIEMKQRNIYFLTEREVRRRPNFLDSQKVKMLREPEISPRRDLDSRLAFGNYFLH